MTQSPIDYYIYYRVRESHTAADLHERITAMQSELAWRYGVYGQLLRRVDDAHTWMEVYRGIDPEETTEFEAQLDAAWHRHRLMDVIAPGSGRHIERFTVCV